MTIRSRIRTAWLALRGQYGPADDFYYEEANPAHGSFLSQFGGGSVNRALRNDVVYACNAIIGRTFGALSLKCYKRLADGTKEEVGDQHESFEALRYQPNDWQTAFEHRLQQQTFFELRGNGYALKITDGSGHAIALIPLHPDRVTPEFDKGELVYRYRPPSGELQTFAREQIHHLRNLSLDGVVGLSTISVWSDILASSEVMDSYQLHFNRNDSRPAMVVSVPGTMTDASRKEYRKQVADEQTGKQRGSTMIVGNGATVTPVTISNKDAQFMEARGFGINRICRMFPVSPSKVYNYERAQGWSTWEYLGQEFAQDCILPRAVIREQAIRRDILTPADRERGIFYEFDLDSLMRASLTDRYSAYGVAIDKRFMLPNTVCRKENLPLVPGGDEFPAMAGASPDTAAPGRRPDPRRRPEDDDDENARSRMGIIAATAAHGLARSECAAIRRELAGRKPEDAAQVSGWIEDYYASLPEKLSTRLAIPSETARAYAERHRTEALAAAAKPNGALASLVNQWEKSAGKELAGAVLACPEQAADMRRGEQ